jgi:hypothetical protein
VEALAACAYNAFPMAARNEKKEIGLEIGNDIIKKD